LLHETPDVLLTLHIKNYALIDELSMEFTEGLNIITGETGAGKSIIIDALGLVLGERADAECVRKGADRAIVEATMAVKGNTKLKALLHKSEYEFRDELILRREVAAKGQSRAFINDSPASLALLKEVGNLLVDLHGQHEHQSLLRPDTHGDLLDDAGGLSGLAEEYAQALARQQAVLVELVELRNREEQLQEKKALYGFQIEEIDAVAPRSAEEEELENELRILENAEKLFSATERLYQTLYEGDQAVHDQLVLVRNELEALGRIDTAFAEPRDEAASAAAIVDELAKFIQRYNSRIEFSPERLETIRDRLGRLSLLKKKYGGSLEAVTAYRERIGREVALAENFATETASLERRFEELRTDTSAIAQRLSSKRREVSRRINKGVMEALAELGIPHPAFETRIENRKTTADPHAPVRLGKDLYAGNASGMDFVEFCVSTNIGEEVKPLVKVASGGEVSRIMLALKMILAKADRLPMLVFDEIDVGVSGRIAQAVGRNLKKLSQFHQIIAITHLPQIAGLADTHMVVEKVEERKRALTRVRALGDDERIREVAKLMSGEEITSSGLASARELMNTNER
jgi:DNA repair protein RecN (Recombination protein N)